VALKDPTMVQVDGRWHLMGTHRLVSGQVDMQQISFTDWAEAGRAKRHRLHFMDTYHCAPQVFYFTPHQKWYLVYQAASAGTVAAPCLRTTLWPRCFRPRRISLIQHPGPSPSR